MKFVADVDFDGGKLRPLEKSDVDAIIKIYQKQTLAGQSAEASKEHALRMVDLSVQMAATQRGLMWAIDVAGSMQGMLSLYDWQPTALKTLMRLDVMPSLGESEQVASLQSAIKYLAGKYHLHNFSFHCLPEGEEHVIKVISQVGFSQQARLRGYRRVSQTEFSDVLVFNLILPSSLGGNV